MPLQTQQNDRGIIQPKTKESTEQVNVQEQKNLMRSIESDPDKYEVIRDSDGNIQRVNLKKRVLDFKGKRKSYYDVINEKEYYFNQGKLDKVIENKMFYESQRIGKTQVLRGKLEKLKEISFDYSNKSKDITDYNPVLFEKYDKINTSYAREQKRKEAIQKAKAKQEKESFVIEKGQVKIRNESTGNLRDPANREEARQGLSFAREYSKELKDYGENKRAYLQEKGRVSRTNKGFEQQEKQEDFFDPDKIVFGKADPDIIKVFEDEKGITGYEDTLAKVSVSAGKNKRFKEEDIFDLKLKRTQQKQELEDLKNDPFTRIKPSNVEDKPFNIDDYGGVLGKINNKINSAISLINSKYVNLIDKTREKVDIVTFAGGTPLIIPKKGRFPLVDEFYEKYGEQISETALNIGTYAIPYVGTARIVSDVGSAGWSLTNKDTYEAIKQDPLNAGIQYGARTLEALFLGFKIKKALDPKTRAFNKINKELKSIANQKTKVRFEHSVLPDKATKISNYDVLTKNKETLKVFELSDDVVGFGKSENLIFRDVINTKTGKMTRIVQLKNNLNAKLKISFDSKTGEAVYQTFWKNKLINTGNIKIPELDKVKIKEGIPEINSNTQLSFNKLKHESVISKVDDFTTNDYKGSMFAKTKVRQFSKVDRNIRTLDYDIIDGKNVLLNKKIDKVSLEIGTPKETPDILLKLDYVDDAGKNIKGFIDKNIRASRSQTSLIINSEVSIKSENVLRGFTTLYSKFDGLIFSSVMPLPDFKIPNPKPTESFLIDSISLNPKIKVGLANAKVNSFALQNVKDAVINSARLTDKAMLNLIPKSNYGFVGLFNQADQVLNLDNAKTNQGYKSMLKAEFESNFNAEFESKFNDKVIEKDLVSDRESIENNIKEDALINNDNEVLLNNLTKPLEQLSDKTRTKTETLTESATNTIQNTIQGLNSAPMPKNTPVNIIIPPVPVPVIPDIFIPLDGSVKIGSKLGTSNKKEKGYNAFVKRKQIKKGKGSYFSRGYKKANKVPLTKKGAFVKAGEIVDKYANRSFVIKEAKKPAKKKYKDDNFNIIMRKFRTKKNNKNVFVEKNKFAIDSFEEKMSIPFEAKRQRKILSKRKGSNTKSVNKILNFNKKLLGGLI